MNGRTLKEQAQLDISTQINRWERWLGTEYPKVTIPEAELAEVTEFVAAMRQACGNNRPEES